MHAIGSPWRKYSFVIVFLLPAVLVVAIYAYFPILTTIRYSLTSWNGYSREMPWVGLVNYVRLLHDPIALHALLHNFAIVLISLFIQLPLAFFCAYAVFALKSKIAETLKILYFIPNVLSPVMLGLLWGFIYNYDRGLVNALLRALGLGNLARVWLGDPCYVNSAVIIAIIWAYFGLHSVLHSAGLNSLPEEILEAAKMDGASGLTAIRFVILPMLSEVLRVSIIMALIGSVGYFDLVYVLTGGGPFHTSDVLATYMYNRAFQARQFGYGSAIAVVILLLSLGATVLQMLLWQHEGAERHE